MPINHGDNACSIFEKRSCTCAIGVQTNGAQTERAQTNGPHTDGFHASEAPSIGLHTDGFHTNGVHANGAPDKGGLYDPESNMATGFQTIQGAGIEPIAIVGMATRLPGEIRDPEAFWELLISKRNARSGIPKERFNVDAYYSKFRRPETIATDSGYFLQDLDLRDFDAGFFNISKKELDRLDPQQRLLLEVTWECLESAGQTDWRGKNIGCYVGTFGEDWLDIQTRDPQDMGLYRITGHADYVISNRVSYEFDFKGPSMTIKTACSSSLIAIHEACAAIRNGDCESAIVGGTNLLLTPTMTIAMTEQGVLSPTGTCKSFDAAADGYARGEAINAMFLKPLSDAIRDGDPIRAIIRGSATNSDGKTSGLSMPNSKAHEAVIRKAYSAAGIGNFSDTAMVECHGTGTPVGDPLETSAIARVFGKSGVIIGSVKPNVGHGEGASGLTSMMKMVLALEKNIIPPNMHFTTPNPKIPFIDGKLSVATEPMPWPVSAMQRVSVNSFGISGANAHVILDSAASFGVGTSLPKLVVSSPQLLVFSANHPKSLKALTEKYEQYLESNDVNLADVAYTLSLRRNHLAYRTYAVPTSDTKIAFPNALRSGAPPVLVYAFTGQGAQWAGMSKELFANYSSYREDIRSMDKVLADCPNPPPWTIEGELLKSQETSSLDKAEFAQPICTAVQIGIVNLLRSWNIRPNLCLGHSSGEISAAYAANALTASEAILVAYYRGQVTKKQGKDGAMAAIGLGREAVSPYLIPGVVIACENSPDSTTISGDLERLEEFMAILKVKEPDVLNRRLRVEKAYHSHHMQEFGEDYEHILEDKIASCRPTVPMISSVTGKRVTDAGQLDASYWRANLESPVLFHTAVNSVLNPSLVRCVFLEIGPHSALAGPLRQIFKASSIKPNYVPTLQRNSNCAANLLSAIGQLHCHSVEVDFTRGTMMKGTVLTNLPTYQWNYEGKYWAESRLSKSYRAKEFAHHDILGDRVVVADEFAPTWRNILSLENVAWIADHQIKTDIVFPGAAYIAMVGEAIRQLSNIEDYTVRNVSLSAAMVFPEARQLEVMTSLDPSSLTTSLVSAWFDFAISSYDGTSWTKHCVGQVRAGLETELASSPEIEELPRRVSSQKWYQTMAKVGLNYGPSFTGLLEISAGVKEFAAVASVVEQFDEEESRYTLHPTTLDLCFQLFSVALAQGQSRVFDRLCIPTYIEELYVGNIRSSSQILMKASTASKQSVVTGDALAMAGEDTVLRLKGLRLSPVEGDAVVDSDPHAAVQLEWKPDIDFLDEGNLMKVFKSVRSDHMLNEKLAMLCILETSSQLANIKTDQKHFQKFISWIEGQKLRIHKGEYVLVENSQDLARLDQDSRMKLIHEIYNKTQASDGAAVGEALLRVLQNVESIIHGTVDALELLLQDDILTKIYGFAGLWDYKPFFDLLTHSKPHLRILEIGAGTGATTATILKNLQSEYGERLYAQYTFTDISAGFFIAAKERFQDFPGVDFAVLDISKDPMLQGFEEKSYDLILASNVIHATPSIHESLLNIHKLLHPTGRLFLQELCPETKWVNYIMGNFSGWWLGAADNRSEEPFISPEKWNEQLQSAGFSGAETVLYDDEPPYQINVNILARPIQATEPKKKVTLVCGENTHSSFPHAKAVFLSNGYEVDICNFPEPPPPNQDIVSLMDLEAPFFTNITAEKLNQFLQYMVLLQTMKLGILWVTKASQIKCEDPSYSPIIGMARTIRSELGIDFATLEMDSVEPTVWTALLNVFKKFQHRTKNDEVDSDSEFALSGGMVCISRFHWISVSKELSKSSVLNMPKRLEIGKKGQLSTLQWLEVPETPLEPEEVQVECHAVGMNFKDVLIAMGIVEGQLKDSSGLGCECAGIIRKVGAGCKTLTPGDRVMVFDSGTLFTRLTTKEKLCAKIPDSLSFEDAATMPCVYGTVIHSLLDLGRLEKGQTVLIHSASGGVGIAAIQLCQWVGATIFLTVGNEEKARYLSDTFGISRSRIFNSRDASFLPNVMRATNEKGVDMVLNSLSGELLHTSWKCVAEYGKMLEIGKRDFIGRGKLSMNIFEANRSFFGIDLARICVERPAMTQNLLEQGLRLLDQGGIKPIRPIKIFDATKIEDAFRYMQKGAHMGKIVVKMPENPEGLIAVPMARKLHFRSEVSYLLVGGLGGLGQAVSRWMAEHGAKNLVYLSRTAGETERDRIFSKELEAYGCTIQMFPGNISVLSDVEHMVKNVAKPIAGVMQMSMVLRDRAFAQISIEDWEMVTSPKVQGTWNLHKALAAEKLDFLILFSSFSGLVGQWGQANYAASNTFLDAFVQYRHSLGLPASVLDIGAVVDVGYVSENKVVLDNFLNSAVHGLREQDLLESLHLMIDRSTKSTMALSPGNFTNPSQVGIGLRSTMPIAHPKNRNIWKRDPRMGIYRNLEEASAVVVASTSNALAEFIGLAKATASVLDDPKSIDFLAREIGLRLFSFLMRPEDELDIKLPLSAVGLDSLIAIEMRNWWRQSLGLDVTVLEILAASSIEKLGELAAAKMKAKYFA